MNKLYPHQADAVQRLVKEDPTYLGFDMGLGKSRTFIEAVRAKKATRVLILCPKSAVLVWLREIAQWDPVGRALTVVARTAADLQSPGAVYTIVSHGLMSQREGEVARYLALCPPFDMTVLDEAHAFNTADTLRTKALRRAWPKLGQVVPLSGTPMRNHAGDLYTLMSLCWPDGLKTPSGSRMTRFDFEERFCRVTTKFFGGRSVRVIEGSKNLAELRQRLAPFMLRVRKEDVLTDLPPIVWERVPVAPDMAQVSAKDLADMEALLEGVEDIEASILNDIHLMRQRRLLGLAKLRGACEYLVDMLDNLPGERKILVFAVHAEVIAALKSHLAEYDPAVITGSVTGKDRDLAVEKFLTKPSCRVFVGNIQAAGTALTLIGPQCKCSDVVFVESSWTPMDNAQAACRIHRIGQHDGVTARMLSADGTIDDVIEDILVRKAGEFTALFDSTGETA